MPDKPNAAVIADEFVAQPVSQRAFDELNHVADEVGGPYRPPEGTEGAVGFTHFDAPASEDNTVVVLLAKEQMETLPSQSLVRIRSLPNKEEKSQQRDYLGVVVSGPFAEPDGLRADSSIIVTTTVQGKIFLPRYHGRAFVEILGEEIGDQIIPPRYRPRPNSPVFALSATDTARVLKVSGDARLGILVGQESIVVGIPTTRKSVLPRHLGILGTTGGGKSNTVGRLVHQLQKAGVATVLIDIEGEYTEMDYPSTDDNMVTALRLRDLSPEGVSSFVVAHLVGRETSRDGSLKKTRTFSLRFSDLSPRVIEEILELEPPQQDRFIKAYDATKFLLRDLNIFPRKGDDAEVNQAMEIDEMEEGYPRMKLEHLLDIVNAFREWAGITKESGKKSTKKGEEEDDASPFPIMVRSPDFFGQEGRIRQRIAIAQAPKIQSSWIALAGKLSRLQKLQVFDNSIAKPLEFAGMITPGRVTVIDLSDTDSPQVNNLLIADLLRSIQRQQEENFRKAAEEGKKPVPVVVIIEEAHEFLSEQRIKQMPVLFQQVARIAKRGRKRWLGLVFVTQLPQHLPSEVLGLINNYIIHKIADSGVVDRLKKSIGGIDKGQWRLVSGLAPGQALVSLTSMTRPLLVSIDPAPCKLLMAGE
jgi:DNA helicase HerA-like ATPase